MKPLEIFFNPTFGLILGLLVALTSDLACAQPSERLQGLYDQLATSLPQDGPLIAHEIELERAHSGSAEMDLLLQKGQAAMSNGAFDAALAHFSALIDNAPAFIEGYNARATTYFLMGAFGQSMADIQQVLAQDPRHYGALTGFGMILEALNRHQAALEVYRAALAANPHMAQIQSAVIRLDLSLAGQEL